MYPTSNLRVPKLTTDHFPNIQFVEQVILVSGSTSLISSEPAPSPDNNPSKGLEEDNKRAKSNPQHAFPVMNETHVGCQEQSTGLRQARRQQKASFRRQKSPKMPSLAQNPVRQKHFHT
jgi:hypothetical protein